MRWLKRIGCGALLLVLLAAGTALMVRYEGFQYLMAWTGGGYAHPLPAADAYPTVATGGGNPCASGPIKVITYNTFNGSALVENLVERYADGDLQGMPRWSERLAEIRERIAHYAPDLIGLQEMGWDHDIRDIVPEEDGYTLQSYHAGAFEYGDSALLYRTQRFEALDAGQLWLTPKPELPMSWGFQKQSMLRYVNWVVLRERGTGFTFLYANTHYDNNGPNKEASSKLYRERITALAAGMPVIATGDFNSNGTTDRYPRFTGADQRPPLLPNTWDTAGPEERYYWRDSPEPERIPAGDDTLAPANRIDHILAGGPCPVSVRGWTIDLRTLRDGRDISDHDLIAAEIRFGESEAAPDQSSANTTDLR
ncbi:MAG: hypothetical protein GC168_10240 [Candidatus Hydrogenedens sp.]|nr:hypothetical protein [Candidatus Hydrogenedens sp.]